MYCIIMYEVWKHQKKRTSNSLYIDGPTLRLNINVVFRQTDILCVSLLNLVRIVYIFSGVAAIEMVC